MSTLTDKRDAARYRKLRKHIDFYEGLSGYDIFTTGIYRLHWVHQKGKTPAQELDYALDQKKLYDPFVDRED